MQEDIKLKIGADTTLAKKDIEKLSEINPKVTAEVVTKLKDKKKLEADIQDIRAKLKEVKLNPKAFEKEQIKQWKNELKKAKKELKDIKINFDDKLFQEAFKEAKILKSKVEEIKLSPEAFDSKYIKDLQRQIETTALKAKALNFTEGTAKTQELVNNLKRSHKELGKLYNQSTNTEKVFGKMDFIIGNIASTLITTALQAVKELVNQGVELNKQLEYANKKIQTISNQNSFTIDSETWRMALETGTDVLELKEGLYEIISSVGDVTQSYALLDTANKLAVTGFTDTGNAVDGLTTVLNAYKLSLDEADKIANIFIRTQKYGKTTVGQFQSELSKIVPIAQKLNIQLDEVGTTIALMTSKGVKTPEAATQIASFLNNLSNSSTDLAKKFAEINSMSVETFMSRGGTLYDILKSFEDWEKKGNKISTIAVDQEAKNFLNQMLGDLEKYKEFLKSINSETDDLNINMNNLMNSQLKASQRSSVYWQKFAKTIGKVKSETIAFIGDMVSGYDKQTAATLSLNAQLEESLKIVEELGNKNDKTTEEQNKLNDSLNNLSVLAPEIAKAYEEFSRTGNNYANVLDLIKQKQDAVNESNLYAVYTQNKKEIAERKKANEKLKKELDSPFIGYFKNAEEGIEKGYIEKIKKNNPELALKINEGLKAYKREQEAISKLEEENQNILYPKKSKSKAITENVTNTINNKILNSNTDNKNNTPPRMEGIIFNEAIENRETQDAIEAYYRKKINKATDDYNAKLSKLISSGKVDTDVKQMLDDEIQYQKKVNELNSKIEKLNIEMNSKYNSIANETIENKSKAKPELLNLQEQREEARRELETLKNQYNYSKLENKSNKIKDKETQRKEAKEKEELSIQNKYDRQILEAKKNFYEEMESIIKTGNIKEIEETKKKHEANIKELEKNKQLAELEVQKKYSNTQNEKEQLQLKIEAVQTDFETNKIQEELKDSQDKLKASLDNVSSNLRNLSSLFQTIGTNTDNTAIKNLANIGSLGSTIFDIIRNSEQGEKFLGEIFGTSGASEMLGLENFMIGSGIGSAVSGALGGGAEGNIGSTIGALAGSFIPIPGVGAVAGSVLGGSVGGAIGSVFGRKSKKKKKREEEKRKKAQERLRKGMISGQFKWADVLQEYNEDLQRAGMGEYIGLLDKVSQNTNYDNVLSTLEDAKRGRDGVSMSALKKLMPQYTESQIMDWFKSITGGAVLNGDTLSTGEGKYGAIDISALAQQITNANRELEQSLKETIKNIIDFSAEGLASVVKEGFFDGLENLGDNIEKMIANSLKNAFLNTEISKNLFNGLSDKVADYIKDMFKNDANLGIDLEAGSLENLTFKQYIDLIKKYMEMSNDKLEDLFEELGLNIDNLTQSMDTLNKNMSKNVVSGIATNLWKQNLGIKEPYKIDQKINLEIPVILNGKEMDRYIIKTVNDSMKKSRRSGNGIGRG